MNTPTPNRPNRNPQRRPNMNSHPYNRQQSPDPRQNPNRRRRRRKPKYNYGALFFLIASALIILIIFIVIIRAIAGAVNPPDDKETGNASDTQQSESISEVTEPETEAPPAVIYDYVTRTEADLHSGSLILVNYENDYVEPVGFKTVPLYGNKNSSYKLSSALHEVTPEMLENLNAMLADFDAATGKHDIIITSAYRTVEEQQAIMDERIENYGEELAKLFVAEPGKSEHHTALAVDMAVYTDAGEGMDISDDEIYSWIEQNCHRYGIVRRYAEDKIEITQIGNEPWHFRYVGKPHAWQMKQLNYCLEEYVEYLKQYSIENRLSVTDDEGAIWEIYYVASEGESTEIPLPQGVIGEISGNN
ncbi:MAG: M15 family metallopeptidase, partial [Clostridia bacterium]|nr:M15 family metallopeptidase [Clostridia bacterium]